MRLIDADKLLIALPSPEMYVTKQLIEEAPTIDAELVKHGHWIKKGNWIICSNCNHKINDKHYNKRHSYIACPYCCAKMDLKDGER